MDNQPASSPPVVQENRIGFREILGILNKRKFIIAIGAILCGVIAALWCFLTYVPVYQASALMMVKDASSEMPQAYDSSYALDLNSLTRKPVLTLDTYLVQLNSREVQQMMIKDLGLDKKAYIPGSISANVILNTNLISVSVENQNSKLAADMANSLCKQFLSLLSEKDNRQMANSLESLQQQSAATDLELKAATEALLQYEQRTRGIEVLQQEIIKKSNSIAALEVALDQNTVEIAQLQAGINQLEKTMHSTSRNILKQKVDAAGKAVTDWEPNPQYTALYEQYVQMRNSLVGKQAQSSGFKRLIQTRSSELNYLNLQLANKRLTQDQLRRKVDRLTRTSDILANKTTETQISKSIKNNDSNVIIVSEATAPKQPVDPNTYRTIALAVLAGLMLFTCIAFLLETIDNTIKTTEDVALTLGMPTVGVIPLR